MTRDKLWSALCEKNPHFSHPNAPCRLTGAGLKKLFDQAYEIGQRHGYSQAQSSKSIFEKVFGKGHQ